MLLREVGRFDGGWELTDSDKINIIHRCNIVLSAGV